MPAHRDPARQAALAAGEKFYFTGRPCANGHYSVRLTNGKACLTCRDMHNRNSRHLRDEWAKRNPERIRELRRQGMRRRYERNPGLIRARSRERDLAALKRIPKWADLSAIREFYIAAPAGMAVDHIVPLRGSRVSGLHVLENLQYLTKAENSSKYNHFDDWGMI